MSYHVVQPSQLVYEITRSRSQTTPTDSTPLPLTPLPSHLQNETFYFDTVEEGDEFRAAAALKFKYRPELCVPPTRHVTQVDLQEFASFISNEIAKIKCGTTLKECYVCVERLPNVSWLVCGPSKLYDKLLKETNAVPY